MKVTVDANKCVSSGNCVLNDPEVFDQDEEAGVVILLQENPSPEHAAAVHAAALACPGRAITVED